MITKSRRRQTQRGDKKGGHIPGGGSGKVGVGFGEDRRHVSKPHSGNWALTHMALEEVKKRGGGGSGKTSP